MNVFYNKAYVLYELKEKKFIMTHTYRILIIWININNRYNINENNINNNMNIILIP